MTWAVWCILPLSTFVCKWDWALNLLCKTWRISERKKCLFSCRLTNACIHILLTQSCLVIHTTRGDLLASSCFFFSLSTSLSTVLSGEEERRMAQAKADWICLITWPSFSFFLALSASSLLFLSFSHFILPLHLPSLIQSSWFCVSYTFRILGSDGMSDLEEDEVEAECNCCGCACWVIANLCWYSWILKLQSESVSIDS